MINEEPIDVWGVVEGRCAWCCFCYATKSYVDVDTQGDLVKYNVCGVCYVNFAPFKQGEVTV